MTSPKPPAGWFPDANNPGLERYFDGSAWSEQTRPTVPLAQASPSLDAESAKPKKKFSKGKIALGVAGAIVVIAVGSSVANNGKSDAGAKPAASEQATQESAASPEASAAADEPASSAAPEPAVAVTTPPAETTAPPVEAAAPAPSEQPAAEAGTVANPLPQPYVAKGILGGEKYSLTARIYDANAGAAVEEWNPFNSDAPAGFKYVVVELAMTGIDADGVEPVLATFDLSLATAEGNQYTSSMVVFGDGMPSMYEGPKLYPGSTFTGYVAYIVPEGAESFLLHDNRKYISIG